jgi:predicted MFS family arabinose efflux permease
VNSTGSERLLVNLCGLVALLSGIVFSMVGALAPMFSRDLHIPTQSIGTIMGSYMLASATSGFLGTLYLDRFDRRKALGIGLVGVVAGLALTAMAPNLPLLIAARIVSGIFAGPSNAVSIAIVVDNVPAERRGAALGTVAAFGAVAQIIGIPAGLIVAQLFGSWRDPFYAAAIFAVVLAVLVVANLPAQRGHLVGAGSFSIKSRLQLMGRFFSRADSLIAFTIQLTGIVPLVAITTIMSVFLVNNLGYPQGGLIMLYIVGGFANMGVARMMGKGIDRYGAGAMSIVASIVLSLAIVVSYLGVGWGAVVALDNAIRGALPSAPEFWAAIHRVWFYPELLAVMLVFALFFISSATRLVVGQTISMRIPKPEERAGFQSLNSAIQSFTMAMSALAIPKLLGSTPDGELTGTTAFSWGVILFAWLFPPLVYVLDSILDRRASNAAVAAAIAVPAE